MGRAVSGVLQAHAGRQLGKEGLDDAAFAQQHFVQQGQQVVLPVAASAGDPVEALLPAARQQRLGQIALISKHCLAGGRTLHHTACVGSDSPLRWYGLRETGF